ncbi:MAG TPA: translation elongation factor Ts [Methylomirabilota bacterium]|jgi:elongation factor Ts|nr:translation elongation factor Ts [Methylomirabilota bacterium]
MATTAEKVRELRDKTGAGVMDCKEALAASGDDLERAVDYLRKKGVAAASKRAHREARDGVVASYIHAGSKLGVLIEVNCETDFVARTEQFQELVKGLAMQVAAAAPQWVAREQVPADVIEREKEIYRQQMAEQRKPPAVLEKIIEGKLGKFYEETCLLDQPFIRDASGKTRVADVVAQVSAQTGEKIAVRRFVRFQVGE